MPARLLLRVEPYEVTGALIHTLSAPRLRQLAPRISSFKETRLSIFNNLRVWGA